MKNLFVRNLGLKLAALLMAIALWRFVGTEESSEMAFFVPLELRGLSSELVVTQGSVDTVNVRVAGPRAQLGKLDSRQLAVHVDLSGIKPGTSTFLISREKFSLPPGVEVTRVSPAEVPITVEQLVTKVVEIEAVTVGEPAPGFRLVPEATHIEPRTVSVRVAQSQAEGLRRIGTLPVELDGARAPFRQRVPVDRGDPRVRSTNPDSVVAFIAIDETWTEKTLENVPIDVRDAPAGKTAALNPATARLTVRGPLTAVGALTLDDVTVWVDLKGVEKGEHQLRLQSDVPSPMERSKLEPVSTRVLLDNAPAPQGEGAARKP